MQLSGKHVVLVGASGGIGNALAHALAQAGARLLLAARGEARLETLRQQLPGPGHRIVSVDITRADDRARLVDAAADFRADVLINNAGSGQLSLLDDIGDAEIERLLALNLTAPMLLCRAFAPLLRAREHAAIVNVGSILGSIGCAGSAAYCASKFGLRGFTEALRRELADTGIRVLYFAPRATDTPLNSDAAQALNRALGNAVDTPARVAATLVRLLERSQRTQYFFGWPEAFFVRVNGLLPALVDRALRKQLPIIRQHARR